MIKTSKILSIILLLVVASASWASPKGDLWDPSEGKWAGLIGDFYYYFDDGKAYIANDKDPDITSSSSTNGGFYEGELTIPASVTYQGVTYPVVGIMDYAFYKSSDLVIVNIPNTITEIGQCAFRNCQKLESINVADDSQYFYSDDNGILYDKFSKELIALPAKATIQGGSFTLPTTVTSIRDYAMGSCKQLTTVTLPTGLKKIGRYAFNACSNLTSVNIPSGLTEIGEYAFNNCGNLAIDAVIPNAIQAIPDGLFQNCSKIKSVTLHSEVTSIGWQAFSGCTTLNSIQLPNEIEEIKTGAFANSGLTSIEIPENLSIISKSAFSGTKLSNVVLHNGLTKIEEYAFANIGTTLTSINIPKSVKTIENNAFAGTSIDDIYVNNIPSKISLSTGTPFVKKTGMQIHVFTLMADDFKNATGWSNYKDYIVADINIKHVTGITLDKSQIIIPRHTSGSLIAMINPSDAEVKDVIYTTSNKDIVTITNAATGKFSTGANDGEATITCTAADGSGVYATCLVRVVNTFVNATSVTINNIPSTMDVNDEIQLNAEILPSNATLKTILWDSSNKEVATVSEDGLVTAINPGVTTITALSGDGNARAEYTINVAHSNYSLEDGVAYTNNKILYAKELTYTRTFGNTDWQPLYVPFRMSYEDWSDQFEVARLLNMHTIDSNNDGKADQWAMEFILVKDGTLKENHPYIIRAKEKGTKTLTLNDATVYPAETNSIQCASTEFTYEFKGTYEKIGPFTADNNGILIMGGGSYGKPNVGTSLKPYRVYLQITEKDGQTININEAKIIIVDEFGFEETTSINSLDSEKNNITAIYNANGIKQTSTKQGLNIIKLANGTSKKIFVK